tara:strand:- start:171 stop:1160 length:990 start_codon:yes stop_codon:yes gene_type:complete
VLSVGVPQAQMINASEYSISVDQRLMDRDWSLLPKVPPSFQSADDFSVVINADINNFGLEIGRSSLGLELLRATEPKDVSLFALKNWVSFSHTLSGDQKIILVMSQQEADEQRFECYGFAGITVGSCDASDIQITSSDGKYDYLEGDIVSIKAKTNSKGVSFYQNTNSIWADYWSVGLLSTTHDYRWLSPVEDIKSPFILGLMFDGTTLGEAINDALRIFPQRDRWRLNQVNFGVGTRYPIYRNIDFFTQADLVYFHYSNYQAVAVIPKYNIKIRAGFSIDFRPLTVEFYGNYYHHNLIGFEPITFNQRTEHRFDQSYGNVGARAEFRF